MLRRLYQNSDSYTVYQHCKPHFEISVLAYIESSCSCLRTLYVPANTQVSISCNVFQLYSYRVPNYNVCYGDKLKITKGSTIVQVCGNELDNFANSVDVKADAAPFTLNLDFVSDYLPTTQVQ